MLAMLAPFMLGLCKCCSNFIMDNEYGISVRTMDLGSGPGGLALSFGLRTYPAGVALTKGTSRYGFVGFVPVEVGIALKGFVTGGMNEQGLSCDQQTLLGTVYPAKQNTSADISVDNLCQVLTGTCANVDEVRAVLTNGTLAPHGPCLSGGQHWVLRDAAGKSLVIEFVDGATRLYDDLNDDGETGFGIMTNEPQFGWHVENARHLRWKQANARPSVSVPGSFYPDERFLRILLLKSAMPQPNSTQEAVVQAIHVLNSITVPMGSQLGTDSSKGEGQGDHTLYGVVYDHQNKVVYWRTQTNMNIARLQLVDAQLEPGNKPGTLQFDKGALPWFTDAASALKR